MDGEGGGHGEGGDGGEGGIGGVVDGKTEVGVGGGYPGSLETTGSVGLIVGGNEGSRWN